MRAAGKSGEVTQVSGVSDSDPAGDCQPRLPRLYIGDLQRKSLEEVAVFMVPP